MPKGSILPETENGLEVKSIYTDNGNKLHAVLKKTGLYLNSIPDVTKILEEQHIVINGLLKTAWTDLKKLMGGAIIIGKGKRYDKGSFMLTDGEKVYPNLHPGDGAALYG